MQLIERGKEREKQVAFCSQHVITWSKKVLKVFISELDGSDIAVNSGMRRFCQSDHKGAARSSSLLKEGSRGWPLCWQSSGVTNQAGPSLTVAKWDEQGRPQDGNYVQPGVQIIGQVCGDKRSPKFQLWVQVSESGSGLGPVMVIRVSHAAHWPRCRSIVMTEVQDKAGKLVHVGQGLDLWEWYQRS